MDKYARKARLCPLARGIMKFGTLFPLSWYSGGILNMLSSPAGTYDPSYFSACAEYCAVCCSFVLLLGVFCDAVIKSVTKCE